MPPVELDPVGMTPRYGWPFVSKRYPKGARRASGRPNLLVSASLTVALGLVIYLVVELVLHI